MQKGKHDPALATYPHPCEEPWYQLCLAHGSAVRHEEENQAMSWLVLARLPSSWSMIPRTRVLTPVVPLLLTHTKKAREQTHALNFCQACVKCGLCFSHHDAACRHGHSLFRSAGHWAPSANDEPILLSPCNVNINKPGFLQEPAVFVDSRMSMNHMVTKENVAAWCQAQEDPLEHAQITFANLCWPSTGARSTTRTEHCRVSGTTTRTENLY